MKELKLDNSKLTARPTAASPKIATDEPFFWLCNIQSGTKPYIPNQIDLVHILLKLTDWKQI